MGMIDKIKDFGSKIIRRIGPKPVLKFLPAVMPDKFMSTDRPRSLGAKIPEYNKPRILTSSGMSTK